MIEGRITRISGPIVFAEGLEGCGLYDVVNVGDQIVVKITEIDDKGRINLSRKAALSSDN